MIAATSRAVRMAQRTLLRNCLDPFEFSVELRADSNEVSDGRRTYELLICSADGAVTIRKAGISSNYVEEGWDRIEGVEFSMMVQNLMPDLRELMTFSKNG